VAGNGIQSVSDVAYVREAGANAVAIGTVGMVRPWRMRSIIKAGNSYK
jgi:dihydroorotate dehydrogenase